MAEIMLFYLKAYFLLRRKSLVLILVEYYCLNSEKNVTIFTIRKENIEKKERTRMKKT